MTLREARFPFSCAAAAILAQACIQYAPPPGYSGPPPPAGPPPYAAQNGPEQPPLPPVPPPQPPVARAPNALDPLLAPIALYPDPLLALVLTSSTSPSDISAAAVYLVQYGDATRIDTEPWAPSVRALAHYPTLLSWMAQNMVWTQALGSAFGSSPAEVMDCVQSLRAEAVAAGTLFSTPQQRVVFDGNEIGILPGQADAIYVPVYDPQVVFTDEAYFGNGGQYINFGDAYPAGLWFSYSLDWHGHMVWEAGRDAWHPHEGWDQPHLNGTQGAHRWNPGAMSQGAISPPTGGPAPSPRLMPGAPTPPPGRFKQQGSPPSSVGASPPRPGGTASQTAPMERPRLSASQFLGAQPVPQHTPVSAPTPSQSSGSPGTGTRGQPGLDRQGANVGSPAKPKPPAQARPVTQRPPAEAQPVQDAKSGQPGK